MAGLLKNALSSLLKGVIDSLKLVIENLFISWTHESLNMLISVFAISRTSSYQLWSNLKQYAF